MKKKILLCFFFFSFFGIKTKAENFEKSFTASKINCHIVHTTQVEDTVKKAKKVLTTARTKALIPPPLTTAGSSCKPATDLSVRVFITASGGSGDAIEWFSSQTSNTILHTGSIYGPVVSKTTTFYVQSHAGSDFSIRVPVVASVYDSAPPVTLISSPSNDELCEGVPVSFSAVGGGDVFQFSVDGVIVQAMSPNRIYTSNSLKKGQMVSVKTRYAVSFDGSVSENAWGKGAVEDNMLSAALSPKGVQGYINAVKISPTEDKLVFGIPGKLNNNRSILLFLDTKPGGFNISNYGDETNIVPTAKGFNFFNDNPSTFDSYFQADYCLAIATDDGGTNYFADIIELKTGISNKIRLGNASTGNPSTSMGVNIGNSGVSDYDLGFEVEVLKSLIGYTIGDIKFFTFTVQDDNAVDFNVTNSFLSPELTSVLDYGNAAINFNLRDPNPVVVSADALIPCYNEASISINLIEKPTIATVGTNQKNCSLLGSSLGGNIPVIGVGEWSVKSGPGSVTFNDINIGGTTATASAEGVYIFTWTISNGACLKSTADIQVEFRVPPSSPTVSNQTECATTPIQTLTATATTATGETVVWYDAAIGGNIVANPILNSLGTITYYAQSLNSTTLCTSDSRTPVTLTINPKPVNPVSEGNKTECASSPIQTLTATATAQSGETIVWYDATTAGNIVANPILKSVGTITYYAESVNDLTSCTSTSRTSVTLTINPKLVFPTSAGNQTECATSPIQTLTAKATTQSGETIVWYDAPTAGNIVANPILNSLGTITYYAQSLNNATLCTSDSRTAVALTINPKPVEPVSGGNQTECASSPIQTLTATATAQNGEKIVWYDAPIAGNIVANPILNSVGTITYFAESVNDLTSCTSTSRTSITLTINPKLVAPVSTGNKTECASSPIQTLTAKATAQSGETVIWYDALTGGNIVTNPILNSLGTITYYAQSLDNGTLCTSDSRTAVTLTINPKPVEPVSGGNQTECASAPIQTLTATATAQNGEKIVWYDALNGGNIVANPILNSLGTITHYAETVNNETLCNSNSRTAVTLTINARPDAPLSGGDKTECTDGTSTQTLTATAVGSSITWYASPTGGTAVTNPIQVGVGKITYYAESAIGICASITRTPVTLTIVGVVPNPTVNNQTVCSNGTSNQTLTATAVGNTIKWYSDLVGGVLVPNPVQVGVGTVSYYAESSIGNCVSASRTKVTLTITAIPALPTATVTKQPSCSTSVGEIKISSQVGVEYSIGNAFQDSPVFSNLSPGNYTISVRFKNNPSCEIKGAVQTIKPIPQQIQFEINGNCQDKEYVLTATPLANSYDPNDVSYQWKDANGNNVGTNSNILNVSDLVASTSEKETFPLNYTLTIFSTSKNCEITKNVIVETIYCNIQKGISPDGNGSNDYFDLRSMDVKKLEIFDRYGIKVYKCFNYTDQWKGQSNKGEDLPSATYYYVIEFNNGEAKTGWIYLIR